MSHKRISRRGLCSIIGSAAGLCLSLGSLFTGAMHAATAAPAERPTAAEQPNNEIEEVVVTARFRSENLSRVPEAITVLSGRHLEEVNLYNLSQIQVLEPSVQIQGITPRNQTIAIRGLGTNPGLTTEGFEPGVGVYIDGVYYSKTAITLFDLFDLDRVEVVRGPQGTLFGKNTTAGAINITTRPPQFEPGEEAAISYGNQGFLQAQGTVTGPVTDSLALSLTASADKREGNFRRAADYERYPGTQNESVKFQALMKPNDTLSLRLIADYNHQFLDDQTQILVSALPSTLANGSTRTSFAQRNAIIGYVPIPFNPQARLSDACCTDNHYDMRTGGVSLEVDKSIGDTQLISITAYRFFQMRPHNVAPLGTPVFNYSAINIDHDQYSQELRLVSPSNQSLEYTTGLYYFHQIEPVDSNVYFGKYAAQYLVSAALSPAVLNDLNQHRVYNPGTDSYSAYGHATLHIGPALSAIAGLRYTYESKTGSLTSDQGTAVAPISSLPANQQATAVAVRNSLASVQSYSARWNGGALSGTAGLSYQIAPDILSYVTYSRGFQAAGLNLNAAAPGTPLVVSPEVVNSYEVGLKTRFFSHRVTLNASLFNTDVKDFQASIYNPVLASSYIANAGEVRSRGTELDLAVVPIAGLTASFSGSYTDAYYVSVSNTPCPWLLTYMKSCNISGQPLAGVSRWAGTTSLEYVRPVSDYEFYIGGSYSYRSKYNSQLNDDPFSEIKGYGIANAHLGVRTNNGRWDLSVWAKNLFNKFYYTNLSVNDLGAGIVDAAVGDPRFFGVKLTVRF